MKKWAKITNAEKGLCDVGEGTNQAYYQKIGFQRLDVEKGYDGRWYLAGYAPEKPQNEKEAEVRSVRDGYLQTTDKYLSVQDFPISDEERERYKVYRQYLREIPQNENEWWNEPVLSFDEWKEASDKVEALDEAEDTK